MFLIYYLALLSSLQPQFPIFKIAVALIFFLKLSFTFVPHTSVPPLIKSGLKVQYLLVSTNGNGALVSYSHDDSKSSKESTSLLMPRSKAVNLSCNAPGHNFDSIKENL